MKQELVNEVLQQMLQCMDNAQIKHLEKVLKHTLFYYDVQRNDSTDNKESVDLEMAFIAAKRIEGCSEKTLRYYKKTIDTMLERIGKEIIHISTDDLRKYLTNYQMEKGLSKVTVDNVRRILSSFFSWLEDEDYINGVDRVVYAFRQYWNCGQATIGTHTFTYRTTSINSPWNTVSRSASFTIS